MSQTYKTLAQLTPPANVLTNAFVTGASTQAVVGTITISGISESSNSSFSLAVRPINEPLQNRHYFIRGSVLPPEEIIVISGAVTMGPNTILLVNSSTGNAHFSVYGVELT